MQRSLGGTFCSTPRQQLSECKLAPAALAVRRSPLSRTLAVLCRTHAQLWPPLHTSGDNRLLLPFPISTASYNFIAFLSRIHRLLAQSLPGRAEPSPQTKARQYHRLARRLALVLARLRLVRVLVRFSSTTSSIIFTIWFIVAPWSPLARG